MKFNEFREEDKAEVLGAVIGGTIGLIGAICLASLIEMLFKI
jgi:hypothetical protein